MAGRLKIFFGLAAGVGKTYAMLEEAQRLRAAGVRLVVGVVHTHGRPETEHLLEGLAMVPQKKVLYKNALFEELDIDEVLRLHPDLVLVDELAHTNVPGSRHLKRWQDVMELLDAHIDVHTTLNVQHVESRKEMVEQIAQISMRETVPDVLIERADLIELVDLTVEELLQRLGEGKVYLGEQAKIAKEHFFTGDRLTALRELALQLTAEKVKHDLSRTQRGTLEILMVAVNASAASGQVIRATRRKAFHLGAPWFALYVDTGDPLTHVQGEQLAKNLDLARSLGGEVIHTSDPDLVEGLLRVAREKGVTQLVVGRSTRGRLRRRSLLDQLTHGEPQIDVHIIRQLPSTLPSGRTRTWRRPELRIADFSLAISIVGLLSMICWFLNPLIGYRAVGFIYVLGILPLSLYCSLTALLSAALLSALVWDYFFIPPTYSFRITSGQDLIFLILYGVIVVTASIITFRLRKRERLFRDRERRTQALYEMVRTIGSAIAPREVCEQIARKLSLVLRGSCRIFLCEAGEDDLFTNGLAPEERAVAQWACKNGKEAGWSTDTLSEAPSLYIPLKEAQETVGIVLFCPTKRVPMSTEERSLLFTVGRELASHFGRLFAARREQEAQVAQQIDQLEHAMINSVSQEFAKPLVAIQTQVDALKGVHPELQASFLPIERSVRLLHRIVDNVLVMSRLAAGALQLHKAPHAPKELVGACLENVQKALQLHRVQVSIDAQLPDLTFDFSLMQIAICNLLLNAAHYSPVHSAIEIRAQREGAFVRFSVLDEGGGIPPEMMELVFEKFYRVPGTQIAGLGLGLTIAKGVAQLHGGSAQVRNRPGGGAEVSLLLPLVAA